MGKFVDITGEKYGRLTAICLVAKGDRQHRPKWLFRCDCGNEILISANAARTGNTKSCGCLLFEARSAHSRAALKIAQANQVTHGMTGTRIYGIYKNMKTRCYNAKTPCFKYYGGKGIAVCDEWLNNPAAFMDWAFSHGYDENLTIDRINSNLNYCPENCRWITQAEQARRTPKVRHITYNGETKTALQWEKYFNVPLDSISRLIREGVSMQEAVQHAATRLPRKRSC